MQNFWKEIQEKSQKENRPIFVLAPMADVTDCVFREIIAKYSKHQAGLLGGENFGPDVFWTEFVSADGLNSTGFEILKRDLEYSEKERPIVAQIFSSNPENIYKASKICKSLGFDGIDINMGCPDKNIEKQGAGASLIKNPEKARAIIRKAIEGAGGLPVSVKTRIGYNKIEWQSWLTEILQEDISALILHFRTRKEMSLVPAHWELAEEIVSYVKSIKKDIVVIGNGDVKTKKDGIEKYKDTKIDGVMIGRGIFGAPWFFAKASNGDFSSEIVPSIEDKLLVALEHTKLFEERLGDIKSFAVMKKHYKAYVNGFDGAKELREKMMNANSAKEIEDIINEFLKELS